MIVLGRRFVPAILALLHPPQKLAEPPLHRAIVVRGGEVWLGDQRSMQENIDAWSLDVASGRWTRLSALDWQRWTMLMRACSSIVPPGCTARP